MVDIEKDLLKLSLFLSYIDPVLLDVAWFHFFFKSNFRFIAKLNGKRLPHRALLPHMHRVAHTDISESLKSGLYCICSFLPQSPWQPLIFLLSP